jgi:hypothetical protein
LKSSRPSTDQWGGYQVCQAASFSDPHGNRRPFILPIDSRPLSPSRWPQYQSRSIPVFPRTLRGSRRESPLLELSHPLLSPDSQNSKVPDTSYPIEVRKKLGIYGLTPPNVESHALQSQRCMKQLASKTTPIEKYIYLSNLRNTNTHLFYRLVLENFTV